MASQELLNQISEREMELSEVKKRAILLAKQKIPQRRFGAGVTPQKQQEIIRKKRNAQTVLTEIRKKEVELDNLRNKINKADKKAKTNERLRSDYLTARRAARKAFEGDSGAIFTLENSRQRKLYRQFKDYYKSRRNRSDLINNLMKSGYSGSEIREFLSGNAILFKKGGEIGGMSVEANNISLDIEGLSKSINPESLRYMSKEGLIKLKRDKKITASTLLEVLKQQSLINRNFIFTRAKNKKKEGIIKRIITEAELRRDFNILRPSNQYPGARILFASGAILGQEITKGLRNKNFGRISSFSVFNSPLSINRKAKTKIYGFTGKVIADSGVIPTTKEQVATTVALGVVLPELPIIAQKIIYGATGVVSAKETIFQKDLTVSQRTAKGVLAVGGISGGIFIKSNIMKVIAQENKQINSLVNKGILTKEGGLAIKKSIVLQKYISKTREVPLRRLLSEAIPEGLTKSEQSIFAKTLEKSTVFGSQATRLRGLQSVGGDIDIAVKTPKMQTEKIEEFIGLSKELSTKKILRTRESVGLGTEKAFDIKTFKRLKEFPLSQRSIKVEGTTKIIKLREQYFRNVAGLVQLRKGGKDIGGVIISGRGILAQEKFILSKTTIPILKQIRAFKLSNAELKFQSFEKVLAEIRILVSQQSLKHGEKITIAKEALAFKPFVSETKKPDFTIKNKRGSLGGLRFTKEELKEVKFEVIRGISDIENAKGINIPSEFKSLKIRTSRYKPIKVPSVIMPSKIKQLKKITPSWIISSKITQSKFTTIRKNSIKQTAPITPSKIIPSIIKTPPIITSKITGIPKLSQKLNKPQKTRPKISIRDYKIKNEKFGFGFRTFVIRRGKKVYISGLRPKGSALRVGSIRARKTLRATFGIEPTQIKISKKNISFTPSSSVFRNYRIRKGKKVKLQNIYIQRRGKRLSTSSEIKSIQVARMRAPKIKM